MLTQEDAAQLARELSTSALVLAHLLERGDVPGLALARAAIVIDKAKVALAKQTELLEELTPPPVVEDP